MSATCPVCHGSGESGQYGMLDCQAPACAAATDRAALEAHLQAHQKEFGRLHERDMVWEAYKLGQAKAKPAAINIAEVSHFLNASIRDFPDFREDLERLSSCPPKQAKIIRKSIYETIDNRVRNAVKAALAAPTNNSTESTNPEPAK